MARLNFTQLASSMTTVPDLLGSLHWPVELSLIGRCDRGLKSMQLLMWRLVQFSEMIVCRCDTMDVIPHEILSFIDSRTYKVSLSCLASQFTQG